MSSWERINIIFAKEVGDNLRDRRSLFSAMASSLIGPVILVAMIVVVGKTIFTDIKRYSFKLPVSGVENAPSLVHFLEQNGVEVLPPPTAPETAVRNGDVDIVLIIPETYGEDFSQGIPATIKIVVDSSRQSAMGSVERTRSLLASFNSQVGSLRLIARGISPVVSTPLAIENIDVATPQSQAVIFLNMMPYFIVLVVFVGGMYVIIDTTAGERERNSLEPLLINPVPRWEMVIGKLASSLPFAIFTVFITLGAFAAAFNIFPLEDYVGFQLTLSISALAAIFFISLPMIILASALQMIVATFTRSFKEAQTYVAFLPLVPALPGIGLAFMNVKASVFNMLIPTFGQQILINQLMRGEPINPIYVAISSISTLIIAGLLILVAIRLFERERIIFGTK